MKISRARGADFVHAAHAGGFSLRTTGSGLAPKAARELEQKAARALNALRSPTFDGPKVESMEVAEAFVRETLIHSHDVATLTRALGGRAPKHDLDEPVAVERVRRIAAPWMTSLLARAGASPTVDVGKLNPYVLAGLARTRAPDAASLALHRLAPHHSDPPLTPETAADIINSIRMPRVYRAQPMSFEATRAIARDLGARLEMKPEARALLERAVGLQEKLERSDAITSYLHLTPRAGGDGW